MKKVRKVEEVGSWLLTEYLTARLNQEIVADLFYTKDRDGWVYSKRKLTIREQMKTSAFIRGWYHGGKDWRQR